MSKNLKIISSVLGVLVLLGGVGGGVYLVQRNQTLQEQAAPATNISITPSSVTKNPGDTVVFKIHVETGPNRIAVIDTDLHYNPAAIQIVSEEVDPFAANLDQRNGTFDKIDNTTGVAQKSIYTTDTTKAITGSGDVLVVTAQIKADATPGSYTIDFGSRTKAAANEETTNVIVGKSGTNITVAGAAAPSPSPSIPASVAPSPSTPASVAPSPSPSVAPSPSPSGAGATAPSPSPVASRSPSPAASASPRASSSPAASASPAAGGTASASPSPKASSAPTVSIPASGTVSAGTTISGTAAPNSTVTITIHSQTITATVRADSTGKWSYKLPTTLENGAHTITIADSNGTTTKSFSITGGVAATGSATVLPETGLSIPTMFGIGLGVILLFAGLVLAL